MREEYATMQKAEQKTASVKQVIGTALSMGYDSIIILVACGIFGAALILLYDIVTDFRYLGAPDHTFSHLISDLMLTLIIMALLNQVNHLIKDQPFTLLPFIAIGLIASVRGFLIAQIKVGLGEIEWGAGLIQLGSYAVMTIAMATCFYIFSRGIKENR
jgi:uncharacterized membrane protein (DUF373 family)